MDHCEAGKQATFSDVSFLISSSLATSSEGGQNFAQQQRRLSRHSVATNILILVILAAVCIEHWMNPYLARHVVLVASSVGTACFALTTVPMVLTWKTKEQLIDARCIAAYASTALLMFAPICLLLLLDKAYQVVIVPLFPIGACIFLLLRKGAQIGFASGAAQYEPHDHDLRCLFDLAARITVPSYGGLVGHLLNQYRSMPHYPKEDVGVHAVECLLFYSVVLGLVLMLLASSPPALYLRQTRAVVVNRFLGALADMQLGLVALVGFFAASETARTQAVLAFTTTTVAACAIFAREHEDEPDRRGEHDIKHHLSSSSPPGIVLLIVYSFAFTVLLVSYSMGTSGREHATFGSCGSKTSVVVAASLLMSSLCQISLQRRTPRTESMLSSIAMFRKVNNVSLVIVVCFGVFMLVEERTKALSVMEKFLGSLY